jgi:hypothetical protein
MFIKPLRHLSPISNHQSIEGHHWFSLPEISLANLSSTNSKGLSSIHQTLNVCWTIVSGFIVFKTGNMSGKGPMGFVEEQYFFISITKKGGDSRL